MAIAETRSQAAGKGGTSNSLFGGLFSPKSTETKPAETKTAEKSDSAIDRMARLVGLRGNDKPAEAVPKPKPAAKPTNVASHGAIRPKQAEAEPVKPAAPAKTAEPIKTTEAQAQAPIAPAATAATPARVAAPASTAMNGAAPVVQTGSFDSRWSGFR